MKIIDFQGKLFIKSTFYQFFYKKDIIDLLQSVGQAILSNWDPFGSSLFMLLPYAHGGADAGDGIDVRNNDAFSEIGDGAALNVQRGW